MSEEGIETEEALKTISVNHFVIVNSVNSHMAAYAVLKIKKGKGRETKDFVMKCSQKQ